MPEEILPGLYRIEVPLPRNPLKAINSYVFKAPERNLIVDTGMDREECLTVMRAGLEELDVDLTKTDFFITHMHADHSGLVSTLATDTAKIYFSRPDAHILAIGGRWAAAVEFARRHGFPEDLLHEAIEKHPGYRYSPKGRLNFDILAENDTLAIGDYRFDCIETPGHTGGHLCLYEPDKKILVSGDHILNDITPNISLWIGDGDPLSEYLASLDKVYELDVELVLPGHRRLFTDHKARIRELKRHHQARADEALSILQNGAMNAFQVASQMTWDLTYESWDLFPVAQKWFAAGEASAHLKYLETKGLVRREIRDGKVVFSV